jgi:hypothetical protein
MFALHEVAPLLGTEYSLVLIGLVPHLLNGEPHV